MSTQCFYSSDPCDSEQDRRTQFCWGRRKLTVSLQLNIQSVLKRKWQVNLLSVPQEKVLNPWMCAPSHYSINNYMFILFPHAGAVARFNTVIGLLDLSKAHVNCHEMLDEFNLYSALILSEPIPRTNCCGSVLSMKSAMPHGALKSNMRTSLRIFLLLNVQGIDVLSHCHRQHEQMYWGRQFL